MNTRAQDAKHVPLSAVDKLRQDAAQAAQVRALTTHPDVVALRTERVRSQVDALIWAGLLLGLAFTMVNVQTFAAEGAAPWSLPWLAAWLLDPMVSLVLVAVLRAEQVTARYQVPTGVWVRRTKVFAFAATYAMNTWQSWADLHLAGIVLHSVPPAMVYLAAETGPILRDRLTEAVLRAARMTSGTATSTAPGTVAGPVEPTVHGIPATEAPPRRPRSARKPASKPRRRPLAEQVAEARALLPAGVVPTPAWVRDVLPGIARGTSQNVANALKAELATTTTDVDQAGRAA